MNSAGTTAVALIPPASLSILFWKVAGNWHTYTDATTTRTHVPREQALSPYMCAQVVPYHRTRAKESLQAQPFPLRPVVQPSWSRG